MDPPTVVPLRVQVHAAIALLSHSCPHLITYFSIESLCSSLCSFWRIVWNSPSPVCSPSCCCGCPLRWAPSRSSWGQAVVHSLAILACSLVLALLPVAMPPLRGRAAAWRDVHSPDAHVDLHAVGVACGSGSAAGFGPRAVGRFPRRIVEQLIEVLVVHSPGRGLHVRLR